MQVQGTVVNKMVTGKHRVLIVGLGKTGLSCARYLSAQGIEVAVTDSREQPPELATLRAELPDVAVFTGGFDEQVFASADELIVSPGVSLKHPLLVHALERGKKIIGDVELFAEQVSAPVIVITGSNGKSTVTSLVGVMAREAGKDVRIGGNIGKPVLELIEENEPDCYVLELSSFQLEYTHSLNAQVATVLNISADHMDRYNSLQEYVDAKRRVFRGNGVMILNRDDEQVMSMAEPLRKIISFGLQSAQANQYGICQHQDSLWLCRGDKPLVDSKALLIPGMHNVANALAALAIGEAAGFSQSAMIRALQGFKGLPHRTQFVKEAQGVRWYNDSKGTNVGATCAALSGMHGKVILIAGGEGKGADFGGLVPVVAEKARAVVLIGADAEVMAEIIKGHAEIVFAENMEDAVIMARDLAQEGDAVLLSPACASFDMFDDYQQRGEIFMQMVERYA